MLYMKHLLNSVTKLQFHYRINFFAGLQASNNEIVKRLRSQKSLEIDAAAVGHTNGDVAVPIREQTKFNPDIGQVGFSVLQF